MEPLSQCVKELLISMAYFSIFLLSYDWLYLHLSWYFWSLNCTLLLFNSISVVWLNEKSVKTRSFMPYIKETLINLLSIVTFVVPVLVIIYRDLWQEIFTVWIGLSILTLAYPPVGSWLRPHRHSDVPSNRANLPPSTD